MFRIYEFSDNLNGQSSLLCSRLGMGSELEVFGSKAVPIKEFPAILSVRRHKKSPSLLLGLCIQVFI